MSNLFHEMFCKYPELTKESTNLVEFINALPVSEAMRDHMRKYETDDYNDRWFRTFKAHGYGARALVFPEVKAIGELFESIRLVDISIGNGKYKEDGIRDAGTRGEAFISSTRSKAFPFGQVGFRTAIREDAQTPGKLFCYSLRGRGKTLGSYARPTPALQANLIGSFSHNLMREMEFSCTYSFEAVERNDGSTLIVARWHIGETWLAIVNTEQLAIDVRAMIPAAEMAQYNAQIAAGELARSCVDADTGMIDKARAESLGIEVFKERF